MEQELQELCTFLQLDSRLDVKSSALNYILGLTATDEGRGLILQNDNVLQNLLELTTDTNHVISRDALLAVLNSTACDKIAMKLISMNVIPQFLSMLVDPNYRHTNTLCMVLSNITRQEEGAKILSDLLISDNHPASLSQLVDKFDKAVPGRPDDSVDYLATVFSNITQILSARQAFLGRSPCLISRLLAYTQYQGSLIRRGGIIGLLRNLCFEVGDHDWLLSDELDLLPHLLLPLAGPEQFTEEENDQLPLDLQYLPDYKRREEDPDLRKMLLEAIMKLCATKVGRQYMRDKHVYFILRELHKWEQDQNVLQTCENLVSILISDEPESGLENLDQIKIPESLMKTALEIKDNAEMSGCHSDDKRNTSSTDGEI